MVKDVRSRRWSNPRAPLAALLSFVFPGLGQAYNGDAGIAWALAAPIILLAFGVIVALSALRGDLLLKFLDIRFLATLLVLDALLLAWRLFAVIHAYLRREHPHPMRWTTCAGVAVVIFTIGMHLLPGYWAVKAIDTLNSVARGGSGGNSELYDSFGGIALDFPSPSGAPQAHGRINVVLVGIDWKPGRTEHLTDTILVVSLDPVTGHTAMISIPRDLYGVKLPDGRTYNAKINSLLIIATNNKQRYPLGGVGTLKATVGELLGIKIDYFAAINLLGFKQAVESIGGVDVNVTRAIRDPTYRFDNGKTGFYLSAGRHHLNGEDALAYVRSRKGAGDNDFTRAARQQQLLTAIRDKLTAANLLTQLPSLLDSVKSTLSTDVPSSEFPLLARAVQDAGLAEVQRAVIQPPLVHSVFPGPGGAYILVPDFAAILDLGRRLMGDEVGASPSPSASPTP